MTTATRSDLDDLKRRLPVDEYFRRQGSTQNREGRWRCLCPASHTNGDAHHSVTIDDGYARCWSQACFGEKGADIFAVVGVVEHLSDFKSQKQRVQELVGASMNGTAKRRAVRHAYPWEDANGNTAYKIRWDTDGKDKCAWALDPEARQFGQGACDPTVRDLPRVTRAPRSMVCEGERDQDTVNGWLIELGLLDLVATTTPNGAGDVKAHYLQPLHGKAQVYLTGDNDEAGRGYVQKCGALLMDHVAELRHLVVPDGFKDWAEWKESGATAQDFLLLLDAAPCWAPDDAPGGAAAPAAEPWPELDPAALHGLAGEIVRLVAPHTEADPVALTVTLLSEYGCSIGRAAHILLDGGRHPLLTWPLLIGKSSKSRKDSSDRRVNQVFQRADPMWTRGEHRGTLSTGEGLVQAVRDPTYKEEPDRTTGELERRCTDSGITDKRLFLVQSEFGAVLRVMHREGNSLSGVLRDAWDGLDLCPMTKNATIRATQPHVAIVGHTTIDELRRNLTDTEMSNGFGNRFAYFIVKRAQEQPEFSEPDRAAMEATTGRLKAALLHGRTADRLTMTTTAREEWREIYHDLSADRPGVVGALLGRAEAQVQRLAALYCLLDLQRQIDTPHLHAALALWQYAEASTAYLFGHSTGDTDADNLVAALRQGDLTDTQISELFGYNRSRARLDHAKEILRLAGLATCDLRKTGGRGRPVRVWRATGKGA